MTAALALLPVVLQYLPAVETGAEHLWAWVESLRTAAQQSAEWTADLETQYQAALLARTSSAAYQPDKPKA